MGKMVKVRADVLGIAFERFNGRYHAEKHGVGLYFWAFVGLTKVPNYNFVDRLWELPEEGARVITMLAGPHHEAIFKLLELQGRDPYRSMYDAYVRCRGY